jgi:hypothetical protein
VEKGLVDTLICQKCDLFKEETAEHFICDCPAYIRIRFNIFQTDKISLVDLMSLPIKKILRFTDESKRLKDNTAENADLY